MALCRCALHVSASDGNIYIAERTVTCDLSARDGRVTRARISQDYSMGARRVHDTGILAVFYDRNSKIEHASATGGKPQYRAWEDGDIFYSGMPAAGRSETRQDIAGPRGSIVCEPGISG